MSGGVGFRRGSDPALMRLWCRPAATAPIGPVAWESLYASGAALKSKKKKKNKNKKNHQRFNSLANAMGYRALSREPK